MAADTADLAERDVPEARRCDPAARCKHMELDASTIDLTGFQQCVPGLEKLSAVTLDTRNRLLQKAAVDVNPGG